MPMRLMFVVLLFTPSWATTAQDFHAGDAIPDFGLIADVPGMEPLPDGIVLKHSFDRMQAAEPGTINSEVESAARFINMHYAAGVTLENIHLAVVFHGSAVLDATKPKFYEDRQGVAHANSELMEALMAAGVRLIVCGQSAAARGVTKDDLMPGVELHLSAMTAHAMLQQDGYSLNPF